jgi:hypothetical protein
MKPFRIGHRHTWSIRGWSWGNVRGARRGPEARARQRAAQSGRVGDLPFSLAFCERLPELIHCDRMGKILATALDGCSA